MDLTRFIPTSLGARIVILMTLAMLPIGAISVYQTRAVVKEAFALSRASLMSQTVAAAAEERELIQQALGAAEGLGASVPSLAQPDCEATLRSFVSSNATFVFTGYIDGTGMMTCSSTGDVSDFSQAPGFAELMADPQPTVSFSARGRITQMPVILVTQPVYADGKAAGAVSISIAHETAKAVARQAPEDRQFSLASVTVTGEVLVSSDSDIDGDPARFMPPQPVLETWLARTSGNFTFLGSSRNGDDRFFAVAPMVAGSAYVVGSWPASALGANAGDARLVVALLFPFLMWATGIAVAYLGLRLLVVRHVKELRSSMRRFALGDRDGPELRLDGPPEELADAERAFNRMALLIAEAESRTEQDLHDKEVLLREIHHRVKNNLQLIASIMNMQARNAKSEEARNMLAGLQRRVRGLAMLHRSLYVTPDMTSVDSADLVRTVLADVSNLAASGRASIGSDLASFPIYPDQAVPLSMLIAEALTNAVKNAPAHDAGDDEAIKVRLTSDPAGQVELVVWNRKEATSPVEGQGDGLGSRLMAAFVQQLEGDLIRVPTDTDFTLRVTFARRDFVPGAGPDTPDGG